MQITKLLERAVPILVVTIVAANLTAGAVIAAPGHTVDAVKADSEAAVAYVNTLRVKAGLSPFVVHSAYTQAARSHAVYDTLNYKLPARQGLGAHGEIPGTPGFTGAGPSDRVAFAGGPRSSAEVMAYDGDPIRSANSWFQTVYHRVGLLGDYRYAGYGRAWAGGRGTDVFNMGGAGEERRGPVLWPHPGMVNVPLELGGEVPDPVPSSVNSTSGIGYPITAQGRSDARFVRFRLHEQATGIEVPTVEAVTLDGWRIGARLPLTKLRTATTYRVSATIASDGSVADREWTFTTVPAAPRGHARVTQAGALISWSDAARNGAGGYRLTRDGMPSVVLPPTAAFFLDGGPFGTADFTWWTLESLAGDRTPVTETRIWLYRPRTASVKAWHSQWVAQSAYPTLAPGEVRDFWIDFVNLGNQPWVKGGWTTEAHLALNGDDQRPATEWNMEPGTWLCTDRLATHDAPVVAPGETARFRFKIRAPLSAGTYQLRLRLVIDGVTWLEDNGVYWDLKVVGSRSN